ncbi:aldehyde dehydrogenase [Celerinatantimonas yamalensis]|uniref:Aldehyde dehydrogenase n=1 Tax=Celerinatantimonas yamalensis TaxID=559956 RepID=A0ABW9G7A7_9GAMM
MTSTQQIDWHQRALKLRFSTQAIIDGQDCDAISGMTFEVINPATGQIFAHVARCAEADVERAVQAARRVFNERLWCGLAPAVRKQVLLRFADLLAQHSDEIALLETLDTGKPISHALGYDGPATGRCIAWNGEAIDKLYDEQAPVGECALALINREPLGVVAAIVPWNFPTVMAAWKLGPALATGNSVILKPSEKSPLSAILLGQLAREAGLPDGVLQILPGFGHEAGQALGQHPDVDCITFTGSTAVGKQLVVMSARSNLKRTFMECGGKSAQIVFADGDMDAAIASAASAIFYNQGEVCTAGSRLLLEACIYDCFIERLALTAQQWMPADPLDPATTMGAIVDRGQWQRILDYIQLGLDEGATLLCGGKACQPVAGGYFIEPTIFVDVQPSMRICQEEIFGPVLCVLCFEDEADAVHLANDSDYGLAAGLWSRDVSRAIRVSRKLRAGTVFVNNWDGGDMTMPFGGYKQSGNGRDKSLHALEKYTELKSTWIQL